MFAGGRVDFKDNHGVLKSGSINKTVFYTWGEWKKESKTYR